MHCDVFPSRKHSSHEKKSPVPFMSAAGQLHLVVIKETFGRVIASRGKRPQCRGINICQRAQWVGFEEISGAFSCHTYIAPMLRKLKNLPTVGVDHWEYGSLVVGQPGRRLSSGVKGRRSSTP
ncbi:hypothetical protein AVEN_57304-1 [Araneus ventricosus]|uniref:Uncharacterized protein n=1 Tax=Araneus ventricosus TaxID=182803 RepID=A0A4Y2IRJ6_ARAVE|nr:hypothetical protein AVEN_57304-1 [Araneus ventricosus]